MNMIALLCAAVTLSAAAERPVGKVAFCAAHGVKVWAVLRQGRDYNNGGTTWARPDRPMFPEPRLNQYALTGDNVARLVIRTGGRAKRR